jgi:signal peptidase II
MRVLISVALAVFLLDQATKYVVVHMLRLDQRLAIDVWPPFFNLRMAWNEGINFGLMAGGGATRWVLIAVALAISAWVIVWVSRSGGRKKTPVLVAAGLLVGGAIGNVVDRVLYGAVADFINMSCCGIRNPYAFNVADVAIFLGAVGLVFLIDGREKTP